MTFAPVRSRAGASVLQSRRARRFRKADEGIVGKVICSSLASARIAVR